MDDMDTPPRMLRLGLNGLRPGTLTAPAGDSESLTPLLVAYAGLWEAVAERRSLVQRLTDRRGAPTLSIRLRQPGGPGHPDAVLSGYLVLEHLGDDINLMRRFAAEALPEQPPATFRRSPTHPEFRAVARHVTPDGLVDFPHVYWDHEFEGQTLTVSLHPEHVGLVDRTARAKMLAAFDAATQVRETAEFERAAFDLQVQAEIRTRLGLPSDPPHTRTREDWLTVGLTRAEAESLLRRPHS